MHDRFKIFQSLSEPKLVVNILLKLAVCTFMCTIVQISIPLPLQLSFPPKSFNQLINPDGRAFGKVTNEIIDKRGLTEDQLRSEPKFDVVGRDFISWIGELVGERDAGVLVAHNGTVDFQFLAVELLRLKEEVKLPSNVETTLCTLINSKSFGGYLEAVDESWGLTEKGAAKLQE